MTAFTPPKYIQTQQDRDKTVLLEERLVEFIKWLKEHNVELCLWTDTSSRRLTGREAGEMVQEYVNT